MATNVSNLYISNSFQNLVFVSESAEGNVLATALGVPILSSSISASYALSSSVAVFADSSETSVSSITALTASLASNATSASYAVTASFLQGSIESASFAQSASYAASASVAVSASYSDFAVHSSTSEEIIVKVKNTSGLNLLKGTAVYANGVTGENINIASASNDSANTMPAIGLLATDLNNNAAGNVVVSGKITGVNTSGFIAGRNIYVNEAGDFTSTKPTGSALIQNIGVCGKVNAVDGEIVVQGSGRSNDLPNLQEGYVWLGDENGVPQAIASSSLKTDPFPYTGSAGIQGDLEVDGPISGSSIKIGDGNSTTSNAAIAIPQIEDYSGAYFEALSGGINQLRLLQSDQINAIELTQSGSNQQNTIRSLGSDGLLIEGRGTGGSIDIVTTDLNEPIFIQPGVGLDQDINGLVINANVSASGDITASAFIGDGSALTNLTVISSSHAETASLANGIKDGIDANFGTITATSASFTFLQSVTGSATIIGDNYIVLNNNTPIERYAGIIVRDSGSANNTSSFEYDGQTDDWFFEKEVGGQTHYGVALFGPEYDTKGSPVYPTNGELQMGTVDHHITGSQMFNDGVALKTDLIISSSTQVISPNVTASNSILIKDGTTTGKMTFDGSTNSGNPVIEATGLENLTGFGNLINTLRGGQQQFCVSSGDSFIDVEVNSSGSQVGGLKNYYGKMLIEAFQDIDISSVTGQVVFLSNANFAGKTFIGGTVSASLAGDGSSVTGIVSSSYAVTASHLEGVATSASFAETFPDTITTSKTFNASVNGGVNALSITSDTASIDCEAGNFFTLGLAGGATTHVEFNNVQAGQTINLRLVQPTPYGLVTFGGECQFPDGAPFTGSEVDGATDVLSFVTFDGSSVIGTGIKNIS